MTEFYSDHVILVFNLPSAQQNRTRTCSSQSYALQN